MRDHDAIAIREFNGLFDRGRDETVPIDHFIQALNLMYDQNSWRTRDGFEHNFVVDVAAIGTVMRAHIYKIPGQATRYLLLISPAGGGTTWHIYDYLDMVTPILSINNMTDFSMVTLYGRAYITPHNGVKGLPGERVYVYQGAGPARPAGGSPPSGFDLGVATGAGGKIEAGDHLFAVAFETNTGFITKPGPTAFTKYVAPGGTKADISAIPIGPSGTVARHILATKIIEDYNGNQLDYELFFIPGGRIPDNVAVTHTVDFFDTDLVTSADYLLDEVHEIPAGVFIDEYMGRMVVGGSDAKEEVVYVSKLGEPESVSSVDGYVTVLPGEGGGVKAGVGYRGSYYILKQSRTFMTEATTDFPNSWPIVEIDAGIGTGPHGVSTVLDSAGHTSDQFLVADQGGLRRFNGSYGQKDLTWKIRDLWRRVTTGFHRLIQVKVDPINTRIYIGVPLDGAQLLNYVIYGDYSSGMEADLIKWSLWHMNLSAVTSILLDVDVEGTPGFSVTGYHSGVGTPNPRSGIYTQVKDKRDDLGNIFIPDSAIPIFTTAETFLSSLDEQGGINHFAGFRINAIGGGDLAISIRSEGSALAQSLDSHNLGPAGGAGAPSLTDREVLCNFNAPRMAIQFQMQTAGYWVECSRITVYAKPLWVSV